jgi:hypothetical protein
VTALATLPHVTDRTTFSATEWGLLVRLPRWVAKAASAAQPDRRGHTAAEEEVGLIAVADGRATGNPFVWDIAERVVAAFGEPTEGEATPINFADAQAAIAAVLDRTQTAVAVLGAKADAADAAAYRRWLATIADRVIGAARTGEMLGMGGSEVTPAEQQFRDRLGTALSG